MDALVDPAFQWDGTTSDLAQQFYRAHAHLSSSAKSYPAPMPFTHDELPAEIRDRLMALGIRFEALPALLQRALVWDSGFVNGNDRDLLRVYTSQNRSMAQLAISLESFRRAGCSARNCTSQFRSQFCNGRQMLSVSHCVTDDVQNEAVHSSMWSTGSGRKSSDVSNPDPANRMVVPEMTLLRHQWVDASQTYVVHAIHTVPNAQQPSWGQCPQPNSSQATGLTVPCGVYRLERNKTKWLPPPPSAFVTKWLEVTKQEQQQQSRRKETIRLIGIIGAVVVAGLVLLLGVRCFCQRRRWRKRNQRNLHRESSSGTDFYTVNNQCIAKAGDATTASSDGDTYRLSVAPATSHHRPHDQLPHHTTDVDPNDGSITTNPALRTLLNDPHVRTKRLPFDQLQFQHRLARGAFGDVWLAQYGSTRVAVKRVRSDKRPTFHDLEEFVAEIQLTAALQHAHLVQFIGVAWQTVESLCMVIEYMANGDLQTYLSTHTETLAGFWTSEKTAIALGVARALAYLHSQSPAALIHRDIKAKNVLLDGNMGARLVDFGVSRRRQVDVTMTAGVGTPFWTAPEILEGVRYTESSDLYSFGVLLTELETCRLPYHDYTSRDQLSGDASPAAMMAHDRHGDNATAVVSSGTETNETGSAPVPASLRPFLILNLVMSGSLRPSVSKTCPDWLRELVISCVHADPLKRPTAADVVEVLARQWSFLE